MPLNCSEDDILSIQSSGQATSQRRIDRGTRCDSKCQSVRVTFRVRVSARSRSVVHNICQLQNGYLPRAAYRLMQCTLSYTSEKTETHSNKFSKILLRESTSNVYISRTVSFNGSSIAMTVFLTLPVSV